MSEPALEVLRPGPRTSVQDLGRVGLRALGVPVAGVLDRLGLALANALVGNPLDTAVLELTLSGPRLRVRADSVRIAVAGPARIERIGHDGARRRLAPNRSWRLEREDVLEIGAIDGAAVATLAVEGGLALPPLLGSRATHLAAGLGPLGGGPLAAGMWLPLCRAQAGAGPERAQTSPLPYGEGPIRLVAGPQQDAFTPAAWTRLLTEPYRIGPRSDRMGMRLEGPTLEHRAGADIPSDGLVAGCLQVPGDGQPILLLADHQTTGGYAKIATVISADLPRLGRARPGETLRFRAIEVEAAETLRRAQERQLRAGLDALATLKGGEIDLAALYQADLISGVIGADPDGA